MRLPSALVDSDCRFRLERLLEFSPTHIESLGVECRLDRRGGPVDLGVSVARRSIGLEQPQLSTQDEARARALESQPSWRAIGRFGEIWAQAESASRAWIPFVFLEFDADSGDPPIPSIFAALDSPLGDATARGCPELLAAGEFARSLLGDSFDTRRSRALDKCFRSMRGESRVLHVAAMLGRTPKALRLSALLETSRLPAYFAALDGGEALARVAPPFELIPEAITHCQIDFDIGPPITPRLGLGYRPTQPRLWREVFARLVDARLCDENRAASVLQWSAQAAAAGDEVRREISHVKIAFGDEGVAEAKCYLGGTVAYARADMETDSSDEAPPAQ